MIRAGRPVDNGFQQDHLLYYRIENRKEVDGDHLDPQEIRSAFDVSVNWSKYSEPWDVIFGHRCAGFASILVRDICLNLPQDVTPEHQYQTRNSHTYGPDHDPEDCNYSHTHIACTKGGQRVIKSAQISATAKREFRQLLADRAKILLHPTA